MSSYLLHIHSGHRVCSVAASKDDCILFYQESDESRSHHQLLPLMVQRALRAVDDSIDGVHLYQGPGSYTGLRIGFSIVKGLCFGLGVPLICSDAGELYFHQFMKRSFSQAYCLSVYHARKNEVYACWYHRARGALWSEMRSMFIGEQERGASISIQKMQETAVIGNAANLFFQDFPDLKVALPLELSACEMTNVGYKKWQNKDFTPLEMAKPLYLKPPHINKRKKNLL